MCVSTHRCHTQLVVPNVDNDYVHYKRCGALQVIEGTIIQLQGQRHQRTSSQGKAQWCNDKQGGDNDQHATTHHGIVSHVLSTRRPPRYCKSNVSKVAHSQCILVICSCKPIPYASRKRRRWIVIRPINGPVRISKERRRRN